MIRFFLFTFAFILAGLGPLMAWAEPAIDETHIFPQVVQSVEVDYVVDDKGLHLLPHTMPVMDGCGVVTDLPAEMKMDTGAVDIEVGDYAFVRVPGADCGPPYKTAETYILLTHSDLQAQNIQTVRFWYEGHIDRFAITGTGANLTLTLQGTGKIFKLGQKRQTPPEIVMDDATDTAPEPETETAAPADDTLPLVMLTTGDDATDQAMRDRIRELANQRGLTPTEEPDLYLDASGHVMKQLRGTDMIEVGAIMVKGVRTPVVAVPIKPEDITGTK